jgi:ubiquitin-like 1-activating enzyme E1 B
VEEIANLKKEAEALKVMKAAMGTPKFASIVFEKVFNTDIHRLLSMSDMWKTRTPPKPLSYNDFTLPSDEEIEKLANDDQKIWDLTTNIAVFKHSLDRLSHRWKAIQTPDAVQVLNFDKDDVDTLDFVSATSNIRSTIFSIPTKSKFDIKQMAGNIIPAIATTNAIVAGLCVLQAIHVLKGELDKARMVFISRRADQAFAAEPLRPPNPTCQVCGIVRTEMQIAAETTIGDVVEMLRDELGYGEEISVLGDGGKLLYDIDFDDLLERTLKDLGIGEGRTLTIVDEESERVNVELIISEGDSFLTPNVGDIPIKPPEAKQEDKEPNGVALENGTGKKRSREDEDDDLDFRKKARVGVEGQGPNDIIIIDEDDDAVLID